MARTFVCQATATTGAPPEIACQAVTDPANHARWFEGAHDVTASKGYPAVGGILRWNVRWGRMTWAFGGRVLENDLPRRLVLRVATRRSRGVTTHLFEPAGAGTRYTKRVASEGSWLELLAVRAFMPRSVRREVAAAARLADGLAARAAPAKPSSRAVRVRRR